MKYIIFIIATMILAACLAKAQTDTVRHFVCINAGAGACKYSEMEGIKSIVSFHAGLDIFLNNNWGGFGLRYHRLQWALNSYILENKEFGIDALYAPIRFPLKWFTFSVGPCLWGLDEITYGGIAAGLGLISNPENRISVECSGTLFYPLKTDILFAYYSASFRIKL